jgi:hypothetical protein
VATWNVQSLLQAGKLNETADELIRYRMKITALQEIRWSESWRIKKVIWPTTNREKYLKNTK